MSPSQTGPQAMEPSPMLHTTMPGFLLLSLYRAAPGAMLPLPPTIALFGNMPNGVKNACIDPPSPWLKPFFLANVSHIMP